jgi:hypothetical protein
LRESRNTIQGWRRVLKFLKRQHRKTRNRSQSRKILKKCTSRQELPQALSSPSKMKQTKGVCQARSH